MGGAISYYLAQLWSWLKIKSILWAIVTAVEFLIWGWTVAIRGLLFLVCADFILGIAQSFIDNKFSFLKMRSGFYKILLYAIAIWVGHNIDLMMFHSVIEFGFRNVIIVYLWVNESLSVIRHLAKFNVPIPKSVIKKLTDIEDNLDNWTIDWNTNITKTTETNKK